MLPTIWNKYTKVEEIKSNPKNKIYLARIEPVVQMIVSKVFEWSILKSLDRTLGFFFGLVEGAVVICLIILLLDAQPFINVNSLFDGSFYYNLVSTFFTARKEAGLNV